MKISIGIKERMKLSEFSKSSLYAFDCDMLILALIFAFVNCSKYKRVEIIKLFIIVPIILENVNQGKQQTKKDLTIYISKVQKNDISKSNFQLKSNELIIERKNQIYNSIKLGLQVGLFDLVFDEEIYLVQKIKLKGDDIKKYSDKKIVQKIRKYSKLFGNSETIDVLRLLQIGGNR